MALRVTLGLVALLCAQAAYAGGFEKIASYSGSPAGYAAAAPMTCSGHAYCFPEKMETIGKTPMCKKGWTYDAKWGKCTLVLGQACPSDCHATTDKYGKLACKKCPLGYTMAADGQCEKACKWGYTQTMVNGIKYCVEQCLSGWKAVDNTCVAEDAKFGSYTPIKCAEKACLLDYDLYFVDAPASYSTYTQDKADSYTKDGKKAPDCICIKTKKRDIYPQDCKEADLKDPISDVKYDDAMCLNGEKAFLGKLCKGVCPVAWTDLPFDKCSKPCPPGFKQCKGPLGDLFCATAAPLFGCDSCDILNKMYLHLEKDTPCKYPAPKPSPKPTPKPAAPKPAAPKSG